MSDNDIDEKIVINEKLAQEIQDKVFERIKEDYLRRLRHLERKERLSGWAVLLVLFLGSLAGSFFLLLAFPTATVIKNSNRWDGEDRQLYIECMREAADGVLPVDGDRHEWCTHFVNVGFSER